MKNEIIVITGQRGCGKSTYIKNKINVYSRVICFDLLGEFTYLPTTYSLNDFFQNLSESKTKNFFNINYYNPKNSEKDFIIICKAINRLQNIMFVIDELDYFCSANYIPAELAEIVKRGRHQNLNLIIATRRPHEIPRLVTSQVTKFITFRHVEPRDLNYIKDLTGIDEEKIKALSNFHYLEWCSGIVKEGKTKIKKETINKDELFSSRLIKAEDSEF